MADLVALAALWLASCAAAWLWGRQHGLGSADGAVAYLRSADRRLRSELVATQRELDAERTRRAPWIRPQYESVPPAPRGVAS